MVPCCLLWQVLHGFESSMHLLSTIPVEAECQPLGKGCCSFTHGGGQLMGFKKFCHERGIMHVRCIMYPLCIHTSWQDRRSTKDTGVFMLWSIYA
jgi:hypothetical protein